QPASPRDHSRLLVYHRATGRIDHRHFFELPEYLRPGDLLITNNTRVIPAKLLLRRSTGAAIQGLFLNALRPGHWHVLLKPRGRRRPGEQLHAAGYICQLAERLAERGHWHIEISPPAPVTQILQSIGHIPLPPYIERQRRRR